MFGCLNLQIAAHWSAFSPAGGKEFVLGENRYEFMKLCHYRVVYDWAIMCRKVTEILSFLNSRLIRPPGDFTD